MYPSAQISYGLDLGEWEYPDPEEGEDYEELPWLTWELWEECWEDWGEASAKYLESHGIKGVALTNYSHHDNPRYALATRAIGCSGWEAITLNPEVLRVTDDDTRLLQAWALLFPGRRPGELAWRMAASFG